MKEMTAFSLLLVAAAVSSIDFASVVESVNSNPTLAWTAQVPAADGLKRSLHLGYIPYTTTNPGSALPRYKLPSEFRTPASSLPTNFDNRDAHPECAAISTIRDQCACGSCFAFGAVEAFEDRICIHQHRNVTLSVEDIISCHTDENMSCQGGNPIAVWQTILAGHKEGDGGIQENCYPYSLPACPCNHHSATSLLPKCPPEGKISTPACDFTKKFACEDKGVFRSQQPTLIPAASMEQEVYENGPITVAFNVHDDFLAYKSGVYSASPNSQVLGGHSVKIIGYGVSSDGVKYWTVANSWNSEWGNKGFFNIKRGVDECGIESLAVVAGMPTVPPF